MSSDSIECDDYIDEADDETYEEDYEDYDECEDDYEDDYEDDIECCEFDCQYTYEVIEAIDYNANSNNVSYSSLYDIRNRLISDPDNFYLGIELETEQYDYINVDDISPDIAAHDDCSLGAAGIEFVNVPSTLAYIKEYKIWDDILNLPVRSDSAEYNCGMHVHLSMSAFSTQLHFVKFLGFFYSNIDFLFRFSNRTEIKWRSWCAPDPRFKWTGDLDSFKECFKSERSITGLFRACLSEVGDEHHTVEVRAFSGTMNPQQFYANIELCHAAVKFTQQPLRVNLTLHNFYEFIQDKPEYDNLYNLLQAKYSSFIAEVQCV